MARLGKTTPTVLASALALGLAAALPTASAAPPTGAALAPASDTWVPTAKVATEDFSWTAEGCDAAGWVMCSYLQQGENTVVRVVRDGSGEALRDGSLRMATPGERDRVRLDHGHQFLEDEEPRLADFDTGGFLVDVRAGEAPTYWIAVACEQVTGSTDQMSYAGTTPDAGTGWQQIDVVQDGRALWQVRGEDAPRTLDDIKATCPQGEIRDHSLTLEGAGADVRVDAVAFMDETTDFWIRPITRVLGHAPGIATSQAEGERVRADELSERHFRGVRARYDRATGTDWTYFPGRARLPLAKGAVVAHQGSWQTVLVGGPLANAVRGPLLVNPTGRLHERTAAALKRIPRDRTVYLVGNVRQLGRPVAAMVRKRGFDVVRLSGRTPYATAVEVARVIERRRPNRAERTLVVASGTGYRRSLAASAAAGSRRGAVLLTRGDELPSVTRTYLRNHRPARVFAVGRPAADAMPGLPRRRKLFAPNPYLTSVEVADVFFPAPDAGMVAGDRQPVDALLAGAYGGWTDRPLLVVLRERPPRAVIDYVVDRRGTLLGSLLVGETRSVSREAFDHLFELLRVS
jgi:hypothetical protein